MGSHGPARPTAPTGPPHSRSCWHFLLFRSQEGGDGEESRLSRLLREEEPSLTARAGGEGKEGETDPNLNPEAPGNDGGTGAWKEGKSLPSAHKSPHSSSSTLPQSQPVIFSPLLSPLELGVVLGAEGVLKLEAGDW